MATTQSRLYNFVDDKINGVPITASRIDAEFNQAITALNQKVIISASAPSSPIAGMIWVDSTNKLVKLYRNSEWVIVGVVHSGTTAPTTMQFGDCWIDSSGSEAIYKFRNKANSAWITILSGNSTPSDNSYFCPTGLISQWPTSSAPTGWLLCDGTAVSRTTYATLFALISTEYGVGDGSTTFNLPNIKGKVPVGLDSAQTEFDTLGETGGAKTHTLTTSEIPSHTHDIAAQDTTNSGGATDVPFLGNAASNKTYATNSAGSGGAHNNLQPYIVLNYIIKT